MKTFDESDKSCNNLWKHATSMQDQIQMCHLWAHAFGVHVSVCRYFELEQPKYMKTMGIDSYVMLHVERSRGEKLATSRCISMIASVTYRHVHQRIVDSDETTFISKDRLQLSLFTCDYSTCNIHNTNAQTETTFLLILPEQISPSLDRQIDRIDEMHRQEMTENGKA